MKTATLHIDFLNEQPMECQHPWPEDCFCQAGNSGIVLTHPAKLNDLISEKKEDHERVRQHHYATAYFEAFPTNPKTYIRGEGESVTQAENEAWKKFQQIMACQQHDLERRGRKDGYATCRHCGLGQMVFEPLTRCHNCNKPTNDATNHGKHYCKTCLNKLTWNELDPMNQRTKKLRRYLELTPHFMEDKLFELETRPTRRKAWAGIAKTLDECIQTTPAQTLLRPGEQPHWEQFHIVPQTIVASVGDTIADKETLEHGEITEINGINLKIQWQDGRLTEHTRNAVLVIQRP